MRKGPAGRLADLMIQMLPIHVSYAPEIQNVAAVLASRWSVGCEMQSGDRLLRVGPLRLARRG